MSNVIDKLAAAGYLTEDQQARVRANVESFFKLAEEDPDFNSEALDKMAGFFKRVGKSVDPATTVGTLISAGIIAGAMTGGKDVYDAIKGKIQHNTSYNKMMEMNPDLKRHDKKMVNAAFNTLHKFNPDYASDPLVAGTFVQNALDMSRVDVGTVNSLVDANAKLHRDTGMSLADAAKIVQLRTPTAHPSQVALWKAQAEGAKRPVGYNEAQMAAWKATAAKGNAPLSSPEGRGKAMDLGRMVGRKR